VQPGPPPPAPNCYVHPDRTAGSICRRCSRPICPDCMREAPVGWQCVRCIHQDSRRAPVTRWRPNRGGRLGNTRLTPVVIALIAINVGVYIWQQASHAGFYVYQGQPIPCSNTVVCRFSMWPQLVHHGQWYRLFTAAFLHASIPHILFNMLTLAVIGSPVEAELGKSRFVALYLVSALGGSVGSYLLSPQNQLGVGASGAIFGLAGAYFVLARRRGWETGSIMGLIIFNLIYGFAVAGVDWRAHLGGLLTGAAVAFGLSRSADLRRAASRAMEVAAGAATTLGAAAVLGVLTLLPPGHVNL
jgi:membrane associated rhomboid family serine protease